jgi:uncharacterized protein (DUF1800 family)
MIHHPLRWVVAVVLVWGLAMPAFPQATQKKAGNSKRPALEELTERQRALHALNRLAFGPRPGDVEAVLAKGVDAWIEDQLHPESIADPALDSRLAPYATTRMNPKQLAQAFPSDNVLRQVMAGKRPMPTDPAQKLIYSVQIARIQQQTAAKAVDSTGNGGANANASPAKPTDAHAWEMKASSPQDQARSIADNLLAMPKNQRMAALERVPAEQLINFPNELRGDQRDRLNADFSPQEREVFRALANPTSVVVSELQQAKLIREIYSQRQLQEVMTDFWFNHFNVFQYKNQCTFYTTAYERDVIRAHAFGKFYDLLLATAHSPAMLMYLDNWLSIGPHSPAAGKSGESGLNENYGRELMELHTLGVDGGYTQADVNELARILTGWTIADPDDGGQFQFDQRRHEPGTKILLRQKYYEEGSNEGIRALDRLAHHPSTAHFISKSIAMHFVADDPPESLVRRMAAVFQSSDGDIREVLRVMVKSPEFWSPKAYRGKLKTPLEFIVSAMRASAANVVAPDALIQNLNAMGMQPYGMAVPTGYSMKAETWETEGALLARINFSTALTQGKLPGLQFDPANLLTLGILTSSDLPNTKAVLAAKHTGLDFAMALMEDAILQGDLSAKDEAVIRKQMLDPDVQRQMSASPVDALRLVAGFVIASPEFQRR